MIKIDFPEPTSPAWKRWRNDCEKATRELVAAAAEGKPIEILETLYRRRSIKKSVSLAKDGPFRGKCAYCECWLTGFQHGDMEHFRPKKGVTDVDDQPVLVSDDVGGPIVEHPGTSGRRTAGRTCCLPASAATSRESSARVVSSDGSVNATASPWQADERGSLTMTSTRRSRC